MSVPRSHLRVSRCSFGHCYTTSRGHRPAYALSGRRSEALKVLKQLQETSTRSFVSPFDFATAYVGLGEKEQATEWLERAIECIAFRSFTSRLSPGSIPCAPIRFSKPYANTGRPSIAREKLLRALLLRVIHSVRSERMLMDQLDYSYCSDGSWVLNMDDAIWDVMVFTKNR